MLLEEEEGRKQNFLHRILKIHKLSAKKYLELEKSILRT